ncbi:glycoside hydrolase family 12 protein [Streptomyces litchfieldiae]
MRRAARKLVMRILTPVVALVAFIGVSTSPAHAATWSTDQQWGQWNNGGYTLYNNIWGGGAGYQSMWANSYSNWGVWANHPNTGGIKSYPNAKRVVNRNLNQISALTSSFNVTVPSAGAYNTAYDIWDTDYDHEIMLWMNWHGAVGPLGSYQTRVSVGGHTWDVYRGSNGHNNVYSFLRTGDTSAGTVDILPILRWIAGRGWISSSEPIGDVQFGYEITSSAGGLDFRTNQFSVNYQ